MMMIIIITIIIIMIIIIIIYVFKRTCGKTVFLSPIRNIIYISWWVTLHINVGGSRGGSIYVGVQGNLCIM